MFTWYGQWNIALIQLVVMLVLGAVANRTDGYAFEYADRMQADTLCTQAITHQELNQMIVANGRPIKTFHASD